MAGALVHGLAGDLFSLKADAAVVWADEASDHVEGGGFTGTVWSEEADDFAGVDAQADFIDDLPTAIRFLESFDFEQWFLL